MAKIEDIDMSKPFAFFETELMKPYPGSSFRVFDGSDTQLILDNEDRDTFHNLIINNEELKQLIEDTGHFQGGHEDDQGTPQIASQFSREQLYEVLKTIDNSVKDKIVMALSKWNNDFVTFNVCSL